MDEVEREIWGGDSDKGHSDTTPTSDSKDTGPESSTQSYQLDHYHHGWISILLDVIYSTVSINLCIRFTSCQDRRLK